MALVRYNPWQEINSLQRQIDSIFNEAMVPTSFSNFGNFAKVPAAELTETENALQLKLEIPGIQAADLDIEVTAKSVTVKGDRKSKIEAEAKSQSRSEFYYGKFHRVIALPVKVQNTNVKAEYQDGILNLTLPKAEEEKNKVVKVNLN